LIKRLQAKIDLVEGTTVEMEDFQAHALDVHENLESFRQDIFMKVEAFQNCYRVVYLSLNNIYIKEREALATRAKFQEAIFLVPRDYVSEVPRLSLSEQTRGDIILKVWETNLAERKRLAIEVNKSCEEALSSLNKGLLDVEGDSISEALRQIDVENNQHNSKTRKEEAQATIQQMNQIDLIQINKWILDPSLQLQATSLGEKKIQERLPQIKKKLYIFEENEATKPSGLVVQLVIRCFKCVEYGKASTSRNK
jgi:glutamyl-tRNA reductase